MATEQTERSGIYTIVIELSIALGSREANDAAAREYGNVVSTVVYGKGTRVISTRVLRSIER